MLIILSESYLQHLCCWPLQTTLQIPDELSQQLALLDELTATLSQVTENISLLLLHPLQLLLLLTVQDNSQVFKIILDTLAFILYEILQERKRKRGTQAIRKRLEARKVTDLEGLTGKGDGSTGTILGGADISYYFFSSHPKIMTSNLHYWNKMGHQGVAQLSQSCPGQSCFPALPLTLTPTSI